MDNWILKRALISPNKIAVRDNTHQISFLQLKTIVGRIVSKLGNLIPLNEKFLPDIVRLRNQDRSKYYLNQNLVLTLDMQKKWYNDYLKRLNDIYWCIQNKEGIIIGTIRLYDITKSDCNQGSFILDENYSMVI